MVKNKKADEKLTNCQLILVTELEGTIRQMISDGCIYMDIRNRCLDLAHESWCVTDENLQNQCAAVALFAYAMTPEQKEASLAIKELTGTFYL